MSEKSVTEPQGSISLTTTGVASLFSKFLEFERTDRSLSIAVDPSGATVQLLCDTVNEEPVRISFVLELNSKAAEALGDGLLSAVEFLGNDECSQEHGHQFVDRGFPGRASITGQCIDGTVDSVPGIVTVFVYRDHISMEITFREGRDKIKLMPKLNPDDAESIGQELIEELEHAKHVAVDYEG